MWYTLVLGSNSFLQVIIPIILWFAAVQTGGKSFGEIQFWRATAFISMIITHTLCYVVQMIWWPFTYWDEWEKYKWIVKTYKNIWKYTSFIAGVGSSWVITALVVSGWIDTQ